MERVVDFHTHYIPDGLTTYNAEGCTRFEIETPTCGQLFQGGKHYRTIDDRCWDAQRRVADMDERNVARQVLSPIPVTNSYAASRDNGLAFARLHNDGIAEIVRARPERFSGLGAIPLQDVEAACSEVAYLRKELGLLGVEIGTTAAGRELDDPVLVPFWEQCNALRAVIFIHPELLPGFERHQNLILFNGSAGYPTETGVVAAKLLLGGYLTRFPDLTIVLAHGGGTLPWLLPRIDRFWETMKPEMRTISERPSVVARRFYCDALTFDATNLAYVANRIGSDRIMCGSDYPFGVMEDPPGAVLEQTAFDEDTKDAVRAVTFRRLAAYVEGAPAR
jgi:aminocarboxymuconate-semialdehyde decarboxylase